MLLNLLELVALVAVCVVVGFVVETYLVVRRARDLNDVDL